MRRPKIIDSAAVTAATHTHLQHFVNADEQRNPWENVICSILKANTTKNAATTTHNVEESLWTEPSQSLQKCIDSLFTLDVLTTCKSRTGWDRHSAHNSWNDEIECLSTGTSHTKSNRYGQIIIVSIHSQLECLRKVKWKCVTQTKHRHMPAWTMRKSFMWTINKVRRAIVKHTNCDAQTHTHNQPNTILIASRMGQRAKEITARREESKMEKKLIQRPQQP